MGNCNHNQTERFASGPHTGSRCLLCGEFLGWVPKPITVESARESIMPFGRHKGKRLGSLPKEYLEWMVSNLEGNLQRKAIALLHCGESE